MYSASSRRKNIIRGGFTSLRVKNIRDVKDLWIKRYYNWSTKLRRIFSNVSRTTTAARMISTREFPFVLLRVLVGREVMEADVFTIR